MTADTTALPYEVEERLHRRDAAIAWRRDYADHPLRDPLWRAYCTGELWAKRGDEWEISVHALADAERAVTWAPLGACRVLVDVGRRCSHPAPCPEHPPH
jgi:hypothetical protein